jgi:histidinol-phosphate phosphatase family protein
MSRSREAATSAPRRAVFFDRDGTLIHDYHYIANPDQVELLPGALDLVSYLDAQGLSIVVVSNQSGIQRGLITPEQALAVDERFRSLFRNAGTSFAAILYCPHGPSENCQCRKPEPGMLFQAAAELQIDLTNSYMVGDKSSDYEAGKRAGCRSILIDWQNTLSSPDASREIVHDHAELLSLFKACESARMSCSGMCQ